MLVVVVRYFGGVKLGVGGLIRAYKTAAADALDKAEVVVVHPVETFLIGYFYEDTNVIMQAVDRVEASLGPAKYAQHCEVEVTVKKALAEDFLEAIKGSVIYVTNM